MRLEKYSRNARSWTLGAVGVAISLIVACGSSPPEAVVVYTSIDQPFAEKILADFTRRTGIRVAAVYDSEAGKTTGLVRRLSREAASPRCDAWWSSEVFGTIELANEGVFAAYESPAATDIPASWKDPQHRWTGLAARLRIIAYDPRRVSRDELPQHWTDARPIAALAAKGCPLALANPQFGTTRGHFAALFAYADAAAALRLVQTLREQRAIIADGNSHAIRLVEQGTAAWCWTDTDDYIAARNRGAKLKLHIPTLGDGLPALAIPCSVALIRGAPHALDAKKLVDYLVSAEVERALAESESRNLAVREMLSPSREPAFSDAPHALDFEKIAASMSAAMTVAREELLR